MNQEENNENLIQQIALLESIAKKHMSKEAILRYGNLKIAHPEIAIAAITLIAQAAQLGQLSEPLSDAQFKELLLNLRQGKKQLNLKISKIK